MYYVYILRSDKDGRLYKGITDDLQRRIKQHNNGDNKSTKGFRPWVLVYSEALETRADARAREKYFKSGTGRDFLNSLLNN